MFTRVLIGCALGSPIVLTTLACEAVLAARLNALTNQRLRKLGLIRSVKVPGSLARLVSISTNTTRGISAF